MTLVARLCGLFLVLLSGLALAEAPPERRVALVIGNSSYRNAPVLPNTVNDARDMVVALRKVGFEVVDGIDLDKRGMDAALTRFARLAQDADAAMFYFAGHGFQFNGENYLVPVEAKVEDEVGVQYETTRLNDVVTALSYAKGVKIMVLDACRNNPFVGLLAKRQATRGFSVGSGLAPVQRAQGMVIAYATQANDVAADGAGRNSPFTAALVREIDQPGLEVAALFRRVQKSVYDTTAGRQTPELSLSCSAISILTARRRMPISGAASVPATTPPRFRPSSSAIRRASSSSTRAPGSTCSNAAPRYRASATGSCANSPSASAPCSSVSNGQNRGVGRRPTISPARISATQSAFRHPRRRRAPPLSRLPLPRPRRAPRTRPSARASPTSSRAGNPSSPRSRPRSSASPMSAETSSRPWPRGSAHPARCRRTARRSRLPCRVPHRERLKPRRAGGPPANAPSC